MSLKLVFSCKIWLNENEYLLSSVSQSVSNMALLQVTTEYSAIATVSTQAMQVRLIHAVPNLGPPLWPFRDNPVVVSYPCTNYINFYVWPPTVYKTRRRRRYSKWYMWTSWCIQPRFSPCQSAANVWWPVPVEHCIKSFIKFCSLQPDMSNPN